MSRWQWEELNSAPPPLSISGSIVCDLQEDFDDSPVWVEKRERRKAVMPMPQDVSQDIASIREWLAKESYLPQDFDDILLKKFLHSCYGSMEKTKRCIERFCTTRAAMTEVYTDRDPTSPRMKTAFSITNITTYIADEDEILIYQLDDPNLENLVYYDVVKTFSMQADHWLRSIEVYPRGHILVFDMKDMTLKILPKVNLMFFKEYLMFLLEGMPVRVQHVHVVNAPSYYEKMYALIKPILPQEICDIITFHSGHEGLHKAVDKKYLPAEYGGDAQSMKDQQKHWVGQIQKTREWYLNDNAWKADLKRKPKDHGVAAAMTGSFRTLSID